MYQSPPKRGVQLLGLVLVLVLILGICIGQDNEESRPGGRRPNRRNRSRGARRGGLPNHIHRMYTNAQSRTMPHESTTMPSMGSDSSQDFDYAGPVSNLGWESSYTPDLPGPNEIECYVEIVHREPVGGRCVRLGGTSGPAVCQSGIHLDIWSGRCFDIVNQREAEAAGAGTAVAADNTGTGTTTYTDNSGSTSTSP